MMHIILGNVGNPHKVPIILGNGGKPHTICIILGNGGKPHTICIILGNGGSLQKVHIIHIFQYFHITTDLFIIDPDYYYIFPIENMYSYYYS